MQTREICQLCDNEHPITVFVEDNIEIYKCSNCGLIYSSKAPDSIIISEEKTEKMYNETRKFRNKIYDELMNKISLFKPHGSLCDVGCRTGNFLELALSRYNAFGIEVSDKFTQYCHDKGLEVYTGTLRECKIKDNSVDVITYLSVFEHIKDPIIELEAITRVLKFDGILVLEIPNWTFWHIKITLFKLLKMQTGLMPLNHLFYYDKKTIKKLLEKFNFEIIFLQFSYSTEGHNVTLLSKLYEIFASKLSNFSVSQFICNNIVIIAKWIGPG